MMSGAEAVRFSRRTCMARVLLAPRSRITSLPCGLLAAVVESSPGAGQACAPQRAHAPMPRRAPPPAQARARFVVQLREPVSRQVSFLQMDSRLGVSQGSVEEASARYVYEWAEHTRDSPMVEATSAQMPAVRGCNAGDASTRKSAQCANVAAKAASIAAQLVVQCSILPFKKSNNTNFSMGGHDPIIVGKCYPSNYPPVRVRTRRSGPCGASAHITRSGAALTFCPRCSVRVAPPLPEPRAHTLMPAAPPRPLRRRWPGAYMPLSCTGS
jgi:hypothetical protein